MGGFAADSAAGKLCRFYTSILGHVPSTCAVASGTPALAITSIVVLAAIVLVIVVRSTRARRH